MAFFEPGLRKFGYPRGWKQNCAGLRIPLVWLAIEEAFGSGWIVARPIRDNATIRLLTASLDPGEAEAIALAVEMKADWILLDETEGRRAASLAGLQVTGILGILLRAKQRGEIPLLKPELEALRTRARFFIGTRFERDVDPHAVGKLSVHRQNHIHFSPPK